MAELPLPQPVRLIGLGVSGFDAPANQLFLPGAGKAAGQNLDPQVEAKRQKLDAALDNLREKFGRQAVQRGRLFTLAQQEDAPERVNNGKGDGVEKKPERGGTKPDG